VQSPAPFGYRNKLRVEPIRGSHDAQDPHGLQYGFCELDNKTFFPLDTCPLAAPALNALLPKAQRTDWARQNARRPQPRPLTLRETADGSTHLYFGHAPRNIPWLRETLRGREVSVPLGGFWQVNQPVGQDLANTVAAWFAAAPTPVLLDVFAGVGAMSLAVGVGPERRVLFERDESMLSAAAYNHEQWELQPCDCLAGAAEDALPAALKKVGPVGQAEATVILDPPRSGCAARVIKSLARSLVPQIVYASCNVSTLARDLDVLCHSGNFALTRLAFFDMFPRTAHFETLALLTRKADARGGHD
jgi:23S rRNA (uracil1939-C5)-methyltransferase